MKTQVIERSVRVKLEFQLNIEKKVWGVSRIKSFKCINFFDRLLIQHIPFDEYNNFRHFKVSYKDTITIFLLLTLIRFHTSFGGSKLQLESYSLKFSWIKLYSHYPLRCIMYYLIWYNKEQTQLVELFFEKVVI